MRRADYIWNDPNRPVSIHLSLDVVSRLGLDAMEAYKSVPHRGLGIGGLLLGEREGSNLYIHDFESVESEHRSGPSYRLSDRDAQLFDEALARHPEAVGIYRTQTRGESICLQDDDTELFRRYFTGLDNVYLLIQPATGQAAFFLPEGESMVLVHQFPFRAGELAEESQEEETVSEVVPLPPAASATAGGPLVPPLARRRRLRWLIPLMAVSLGMATGAILYEVLNPGQHRAPSSGVPAAVPITSASKQAEAADHVALNVQRDGPSLRLVWDRNSPVIRNAAKAILYINDGDHESQLSLDPRELGSGLVSYWPDSKDVTFRMEVFAAGHSTDDSIRVVGGVAVPSVAARRAEPVRPAAPAPQPPPASSLSVPPQQRAAAPSSQGSASRSAEQHPESTEPRPSPFTPVPKPMIAATAATPTTAPAPQAPPASTQVSVRVEPVSGSRGVIGRIPFFRRFKKQPQTFVPPAPVREVRPSLSARERHALIGTVPMDVKVFVGDTGKVQYVELVSNIGQHEDLASLAVYAARRWEFSPARLGQEKVPGEVILHFRFSPEEPPEATH
jgi:hypothetical protein